MSHYDPLDDFFRGFFVKPMDFGAMPEAPTLALDIRENNSEYLVYVELPGIRKEDIHVHIDGGVVSITAERKREKVGKEGDRVLRSERYFGKVSRSILLDQEIDEAKSTAKFVDGVLELTLPKNIARAFKRLPID